MTLQQQIIPPAYDGVDADSAPDLVPATKAPRVENLLVDRPGKLPMRGPLNARVTDLGGFPARVPVATWGNDYNALGANVLVGFKSGLDGADPWTTLFQGVADANDLARGDLELMYVDLLTGRTASTQLRSYNQIPGPRHTHLAGGVWGIGFDSDDSPIRQNAQFNHAVAGYARPRKLLEWDGALGSAPVVVNGAPDCCIDVISHLNRLWVLGGRDIPSGARDPHLEPSTLFYSVSGSPWASDPSTGLTPDTPSAWKDFDPATQSRPRTNKIVVGSVADAGVGLAKAGNMLVIFKRHGIFTLSGYDPSNFAIRQFSNSVGCVDARTIVHWGNGVMFLSDHGYMYFDGAQLINLSDGVVSLTAAQYAEYDGTRNLYASAARLPNDYVALTIGILPDVTLFSGMLHVPRRAWTLFSSDVLPSGVPQTFGFATGVPFLVSANRLIRCDHLTYPHSAPRGSYGIDRLSGQLFTWTQDPNDTTFSGTDDSLTNTLTEVELFPSDDGVQAAIPARWESRLFPLSTPFYRAQLHRALVEYNAKYATGDDDEPSWTVTVRNGDGEPLADPYDVPGQGSPTRYPLRRVDIRDNFNETVDARIVVEWDQPPRPLEDAEILSTAIEYQTTSQRRNPS